MKLRNPRDHLPPPDFKAIIRALNRCSLLPGSSDKRFIRDMDGRDPKVLTERQRSYLLVLAWKYRRQVPAILVPADKPPAVVPQEKPCRSSTTKGPMTPTKPSPPSKGPIGCAGRATGSAVQLTLPLSAQTAPRPTWSRSNDLS